MTVEVAYARTDEQRIVKLQIPTGCSVQQAIEQSGLLTTYIEIDLTQHKVGIFGKLSTLTTALQPGDRVEIYRPLIADPKEARKKRAAQGKPMKKG
jgi:putative ubiquitin-RnfH superfamily antitoxin RatB of RatAB toxin-antitoxin module